MTVSTRTQTLPDAQMGKPVALFRSRAEGFATLLAGASDRWDAPSPCQGWSVRDVVAHVVTTERGFLASHGLPLGPEPDPADPGAAWDRHAEAVLAAVSEPDVADRPYDGYFGRTTVGRTLGEFYGWDLVIHAWDVARATDQPWSIPEAEVAALSRDADGWGDALYSEGICRPAIPVAEDASPADRLLARLGRDPLWRP